MEEQNSPEWQAPPPPERIEAPEQAEMSEAATLGNIFIEPERTFQDLRRKPRFIMAGLIIAILVTGYTFGLRAKVGDDGMRRFMTEQIEKSPQGGNLSPKYVRLDLLRFSARCDRDDREFHRPCVEVIGRHRSWTQPTRADQR